MAYVILVRMNDWSRRPAFIHDGEPDQMAVFDDETAAEAFAETNDLLQARPYQIVELDI